MSNVFVIECVLLQNVFSYKVCYRMCSLIERVLLQKLFSNVQMPQGERMPADPLKNPCATVAIIPATLQLEQKQEWGRGVNWLQLPRSDFILSLPTHGCQMAG